MRGARGRAQALPIRARDALPFPRVARRARPMHVFSGMSTPYPVEIQVTPPVRFDRLQVLLRIAILVAIGALGASMGWIGWALYLALPLVAAVAISTRGGTAYLVEVGPPLGRLLGWVVAFYGYMMLVVDRFPTQLEDPGLRVAVRTTGAPTVGSALLRWLTSLPSAAVFALLGVIAGLLAFLAALWILVTETEPAGIVRFQIGMVRWNARLLAYHASLVEEYPPFAFDEPMGRAHAAA